MAGTRVGQIVVRVAVALFAGSTNLLRLAIIAGVTSFAAVSAVALLAAAALHVTILSRHTAGCEVVVGCVRALARQTGVRTSSCCISIVAFGAELAMVPVGVMLAHAADSSVRIAGARMSITVAWNAGSEHASRLNAIVSRSTELAGETRVRSRALALFDRGGQKRGRIPIWLLIRDLQSKFNEFSRFRVVVVGCLEMDGLK
jgi:hypothetical protein